MKILNLSLALGVLALATAHPASAQSTSGTNCPAMSSDTFSQNVVRNFRVYTDPQTGDSKVETLPINAKQTPLLKTGKILKEFDFGTAKKVQIVIAPPDLDLPLHPSPGLESFLVLYGTTDMVVADGTHILLQPGDMVTMDDMASKTGHGGHIGPCGYIDLNIVPK